MLPMDSTDPIDPTESTERIEPADASDAMDPLEAAEKAEKNEAAENAEAVDVLENAEASECADASEAMERVLRTDGIDMRDSFRLTVSSGASSMRLRLDTVKPERDDVPVSSPTPSDAREALLAAARTELEEHGLGALGLRAVARRAGLSHAAPGYFFGDRAGMLTALATTGFLELAESLERDSATGDRRRLARLGDLYVAFGLQHGALYDLMFHRAVLRPDDPHLQAAQQRAIAPLLHSTGEGDSVDAVLSWALVHGLVTLAREGALPVEQELLAPTLKAITARLAEALESGPA